MFDFERLNAAVLALRQKQLFFAGGTVKSGTTWLQLLLDAHPSVSCSGEGQFARLCQYLQQALEQHRREIEVNNKELFNELEGYVRLANDDLLYVLASSVALCLIRQDKGKAVRAVGDKTPANIHFLPPLATLFPTAKFLQIVRDGRDCAVSGWFHNQRNPKWTALNRGSLEAYVRHFAEGWANDLAQAQEFADRNPQRIRRIRYEDLAADTEHTLAGIFEFLGVEADTTVLTHCRTQASFSNWSGGRRPGQENRLSFFRKGVVGDWRNHFSDEVNVLFRERAGTWLDRLGYP